MPITISGAGFLSGATVTIGGTAATNVLVSNQTTITAKTAAHLDGTFDVVVKNPDAQTGTITGGFTYADFQGSWSGTTSQAQPITFSVDSTNSLTSLNYPFPIVGASCNTTGSFGYSASPGLDVSLGAFIIHPVGTDTTAGAMGSSTSASGHYRVSTTAGCVGTAIGTWTATKH